VYEELQKGLARCNLQEILVLKTKQTGVSAAGFNKRSENVRGIQVDGVNEGVPEARVLGHRVVVAKVAGVQDHLAGPPALTRYLQATPNGCFYLKQLNRNT
jgi:hypothetical protein